MVTQSVEWTAPIEVNWGELLHHELRRYCMKHDIDKSAIFAAVASVLGVSRPTIAKFENVPDVPLKQKDRSSAVALLLAIDADLAKYELSLKDRRGMLAEITPQRFVRLVRVKIDSGAVRFRHAA